MDLLKEAWRIAASDPDAARELVFTTVDGDENSLVLAQECLAKVFAVTGSWDLARAAYMGAAASSDPLDAARAAAFRGTSECLPVLRFTSDREAIAAELDLVVRCLAGEVPATRRMLVEIRRALQPASTLARIAAVFGLGPEDVSLMMAAVASIAIADQVSRRTPAEWNEVLVPSQLGRCGSVERLVHHRLCAAIPQLVPHPSLVSRLLGRCELDHPSGIRLDSLDVVVQPLPTSLSRVLLTTRGIAIIHGEPATARTACAAAIGAQCGRRVFAMRPSAGAESADFASAALEAALHGGMLAIDLDDWSARGIEIAAFSDLIARTSMFVLGRHAAAIPADRVAFLLEMST